MKQVGENEGTVNEVKKKKNKWALKQKSNESQLGNL